MAENGREITEYTKTTVDKELRIRNIKDKQNDERQRKLEEIKAQALAAQRFKEQKEQERRKRLDELKGKEDIRRQQVEERKKLIYQAEQDRLISILKRNQEREARMESKRRNEKSNIVFAFGSSTPRMLDPTDMMMSSSYWGHRRATSTQNITCSTGPTVVTLTRRQSERDLDNGSKKRASSASGLERSGESSAPMTPAGCISGYVGRRRTDLMPTIPSRDSSFGTSRKSLNHSPGRAYSMSRLDQLSKPRKRNELPAVVELSNRPLSLPRQSSITRSMSHLAVNNKTTIGSTTTRRLNKTDSRSMHQLAMDTPPLITPRTTRATQLRQQKLHASSNCSEASSRPSSSLSQQSSTSVTSSVSVRHRPSSAPRRQRPASIAITGITNDLKNNNNNINDNNNRKSESKPPLPKNKKSIISKDNKIINKKSPVDNTPPKNLATSPVSNNNNNPPVVVKNNSEATKLPPNIINNNYNNNNKENGIIQQSIENNNEIPEGNLIDISTEQTEILIAENLNEQTNENGRIDEQQTTDNSDIIQLNNTEQMKTISSDLIKSESNQEVIESKMEDDLNQSNEMSTSMTKTRITTVEEAKAALAERRRLAREEAERQAEQERLRIEAERQAELERQRKEEEQVQLLIEQQRAAEQERLEEAIKETQKREEEERLRKEEEQRLKVLKEEAEKKAKEEAERQKAELQERLKNEEKEREARRKRVEAIMLRTRGKNSNASLQQSMEDKDENKSENKLNGTKPVDQENGTKNGKDDNIVDDNNIITDNSMKNTNTTTIDTINSNNSWQATQTFDPLM